MARRTLTSSNPGYSVLRTTVMLGVLLATSLIGGIKALDLLDSSEEASFESLAKRVAATLADGPDGYGPSQLDRLGELLDVRFERFERSAVGGTTAAMRAAEIGRPTVYRNQAGDELTSVLKIPGVDGFVRMNRGVDRFRSSLRALVVQTTWSMVILSSLCLALVFWRSNRDRTDIKSIVDGASRFAGGDLVFRIPLPGDAEWDRLAISLNRMARQIADQLRSLEAQRLQQRSILESMGSSVIALDENHRLLSANRGAEQLFELSRNDHGRLLQEVLREPELHQMVELVLEDGSRQSREFESAALPNKRLSAIAEQMVDADRKPIGAVLLVDDVTDIRRLESMRSDFAANVSHELRTPITNIRGYIETLQEIPLDDAEQARKFLQIIQRNAERLGMIIEDLLMLARLEQSGGAEDDLLPRSLDQIIEEVIERQAPSAGVRGIELRVESPGFGLEVLTRGDLLVEAISNLVSNAVRYGPGDQPVVIRTEDAAEQGLVRISVTDEGPGIPPEHAARLFERFYRVDKARSRAEGGTGLGLAIVKHIALVHGGSVSLDSRVGAGSTFTIEVRGLKPPTQNGP